MGGDGWARGWEEWWEGTLTDALLLRFVLLLQSLLVSLSFFSLFLTLSLLVLVMNKFPHRRNGLRARQYFSKRSRPTRSLRSAHTIAPDPRYIFGSSLLPLPLRSAHILKKRHPRFTRDQPVPRARPRQRSSRRFTPVKTQTGSTKFE